jgi:hypothetical protein
MFSGTSGVILPRAGSKITGVITRAIILLTVEDLD